MQCFDCQKIEGVETVRNICKCVKNSILPTRGEKECHPEDNSVLMQGDSTMTLLSLFLTGFFISLVPVHSDDDVQPNYFFFGMALIEALKLNIT